jgi:polar amino acid transport system substrate-binding protein
MQSNRLSVLVILFFSLLACKPASVEQAESTAAEPDPVTSESASSQQQKPDCELVLGFDVWVPYQYLDVGNRVAGLDIEMVEMVLKNVGCKLTYQRGTWVTLLDKVRNGQIDMIVGASKTPAREEFALFSDAYRVEEFSLYIRKDDEKNRAYQTVAEFVAGGGKIGVVGDYFYGPQVSMLQDGSATASSFMPAIMGEFNVVRLLDEDVDGFLEDSFVAASMFRRKALTELIVPQGIVVNIGEVYVMFSKDNVSQDIIDSFNSELHKIQSDGSYEKLVEKYSN